VKQKIEASTINGQIYYGKEGRKKGHHKKIHQNHQEEKESPGTSWMLAIKDYRVDTDCSQQDFLCPYPEKVVGVRTTRNQETAEKVFKRRVTIRAKAEKLQGGRERAKVW